MTDSSYTLRKTLKTMAPYELNTEGNSVGLSIFYGLQCCNNGLYFASQYCR